MINNLPPDNNSEKHNILIKSIVIGLIILAFVLFIALFDYSYLNDGEEIFQSLKNGG